MKVQPSSGHRDEPGKGLRNKLISIQLGEAEAGALEAAAARANRTLAEHCRELLLASLRDSEEEVFPDIDFGKLEREFWEREQLEARLNAEVAGFAKAIDRLTYQDCLRLRDLRMNGPCGALFDTWKSGGIYAVKAAVCRK